MTSVQRETKQFWAIRDDGHVVECEGFKTHEPGVWWCPSVGYSGWVGTHIFEDKRTALLKSLTNTTSKIDALKGLMDYLERELA